jgi:hypothetical protein
MIAARFPDVGNADLVLVFNVIVTAFTGAMVLLSSRTLGYSMRTSVVATFIFGLGTIAWPYSKGLLSEPGSSLFMLSSIYCLLCFEQNRRSVLAAAGALLGMASCPTATDRPAGRGGFCGVCRERSTTGRKRRARCFAFAGFSLAGLYNYARFGNAWTTGYGPHEFTTPL